MRAMNQGRGFTHQSLSRSFFTLLIPNLE